MSKKQLRQAIDATEIESIKQQIAYRIWEEEGRPDGRADAHWLAACSMVDAMIADAQELPAWLKRAEQPAEAAREAIAEADAAMQPKAEAARLQEVARRFVRAT